MNTISPERVRALVAATGRDRHELSRLLGYASDNSLRQAETGKAALPEAKAAWLEAYAEFRSELAKKESEWLAKNAVSHRLRLENAPKMHKSMVSKRDAKRGETKEETNQAGIGRPR